MKFNSLFLLVISLATVPSLVDIHPASAQRPCPRQNPRCRGIYTPNGAIRGPGTIPAELQQRLDVLIAKGSLSEAQGLLVQFLQQSESKQDLVGQAAAHQALASLDVKMNNLNSASSHLKNAEALYQQSGKSELSSEVRVQLRQIQLQQIQLQQIQLWQR